MNILCLKLYKLCNLQKMDHLLFEFFCLFFFLGRELSP